MSSSYHNKTVMNNMENMDDMEVVEDMEDQRVENVVVEIEGEPRERLRAS